MSERRRAAEATSLREFALSSSGLAQITASHLHEMFGELDSCTRGGCVDLVSKPELGAVGI
jgi:hypothetical protein